MRKWIAFYSSGMGSNTVVSDRWLVLLNDEVNLEICDIQGGEHFLRSIPAHCGLTQDFPDLVF